MEILYVSVYYPNRSKKIEVYDGEIFLNPKPHLMDLAQDLVKFKYVSSQTECFDVMYDLKKAAANFHRYENKNKEYIKMKYTEAYDENDQIIYSPHLAYIEKKSTSIHATSTSPKKLRIIQTLDAAMPSAITEHAQNPVTVITWGISKIKESTKHI
jgi:hypothetical protein